MPRRCSLAEADRVAEMRRAKLPALPPLQLVCLLEVWGGTATCSSYDNKTLAALQRRGLLRADGAHRVDVTAVGEDYAFRATCPSGDVQAGAEPSQRLRQRCAAYTRAWAIGRWLMEQAALDPEAVPWELVTTAQRQLATVRDGLVDEVESYHQQRHAENKARRAAALTLSPAMADVLDEVSSGP